AQDLAEKNKRIITLGFVSDEDLASLYNAALLFTMPSFYEGFGLPVLEAMQSGCPVVISDKGSLKEIAGEAAVYVDPYEADSIKKGIEKLMSDSSLRKKLSEKGIERAKKFSWRQTAVNTIEVYKKIARIS
ncbi:MAG: glycosyltransferase family 1 protein, partial [Patescibacteria group bacterium]